MIGIDELEVEDLDGIVQDFLLESAENLDEFDRALVALEHDPDSRDLLFAIFRIVHTIKGTCGFLPFRQLERLAHTGEELLVQLRDGHLRLDSALTDVLLDLGDAIRAALRTIESTGTEGRSDHDALLARMEQARDSVADGGNSRQPAAVAVTDPADDATREVGDAEAPDLHNLDVHGGAPAAKVRVDVELLDSMMSLVGELVLTRNRLSQCAASSDGPEIRHLTQRLQVITSGFQDRVMQARMQPIGTVWKQMPRVVRDLGAQLGKPVALETSGESTELDRTLLEAIKDPLTHILRNGVDHGVETPEVRASLGKPEVARLSIDAYPRGGLVHIDVADDGAGIDVEALRTAAVARGLVTSDAAARLTEPQALDLIFHPGLSTAAEVSNVSGRGVGMDVVRTNIEQIGGLVEVESRPGRGTVFRIKIPLTLAIVPAVVVRADEQRFAVPQGYVRELVQLPDLSDIEHTHRSAVYRLRGELLPLVDVRSQLRLPAAEGGPGAIVVLTAQGAGVGLVVDAIVGTEEIVVKPLGAAFRDLRVYAGAATMSDGGLALILDVAEIARRAGVAADIEDRGSTTGALDTAGAAPIAAPDVDAQADAGVPALLVELVDGSRAVVPLDAIRRLEKLSAADVDRVGDSAVVSYREGVLPLVDAVGDSWTGAGRRREAEPELLPGPGMLTIIVCHVEGVTVGLPVAGIVDTVVARPLSDTAAGSSGPMSVEGRILRMLDLDDLLLRVDRSLMPHTTRVGVL